MSNFQPCLPTCSSSSASSSSSYPQHPLSVEGEKWWMLERTANGIISSIRPDTYSEKTRMTGIKIIEKLFLEHLGIKVFPYGSVPLKTYLPDGDIDMSAITHQNTEDAVANNFYQILKAYEQNNFGFLITDVTMIDAQVKVVKCILDHIPVDISFNKVGGFSSLCFLETVNKDIQKGHLFKQSIILIKAWCYYESRILGASYGLISTYALETMILHIINLFHSHLRGPLSVLYTFLEYYSSFDWERFGISLDGLIILEALPDVVVQRPQIEDDMLLGEDLIQRCKNYFSIPIRAVRAEGGQFQLKPINILDPLNDENNLGRSISLGNFYRIKSALSYGYKKLTEVLMLQESCISDGIKKFFVNTINRRHALEMENRVAACTRGRYYKVANLHGNCTSSFEGMIYGQYFLNYTLPFPRRPQNVRPGPAFLETNVERNSIHLDIGGAAVESNDDGNKINIDKEATSSEIEEELTSMLSYIKG
ncbi:hypothetical protein ABFS82_06G059200 [Erythranthe guttata]|nr:PREDICTED: uncharacterized protein LOC105977722 isoform X1 [Erythranthe guttata]XP_012858534.1 PREDICTED: uncharacterized protein LOC105977722 isoform X1 [Erythranthe guttata]|eukprot:XP_012858533.1 PREDICTED: uncharacterized protein LOC105977722 isoform X1 [Erythranthe guttata]